MLTTRDAASLEKMRLEYDFRALDGRTIRVFSVPGTYDGWRMLVNGIMGYACHITRFRDGGTTRVASELGELYVPARGRRDRCATFHPRSRDGDGRLLDSFRVESVSLKDS